jgi:membrane fusion protein, multidrug efflux system
MIGFFKRNIIKFIILIIVAVLGFVSYNVFFASKKVQKKEFTKVRKGTLSETLTISGKIEADEHVILRFQTSGRLAWVGVKEGDYVKKYQTLASLDKRELQKQLEKDLNDYMATRWDYDETTKRGDWTDKFVTDNTMQRIFDKAQFTLNKSVLDVEIQNLTMEYANLFTPIEGIVTRISSPFAGVNITPASAEFEILNPKTVYFQALADQNEVVKLSEKLPGELTLDSFPDSTIPGTIKTISFTPKTGETGTVYTVKFTFTDDNSSYKYKMGMTGDLSFVTKKKEDVLYLPIKYVKNENGKKYVTIQKNGKDDKKYVETGMETDNEIEITKGLSEGEAVYN